MAQHEEFLPFTRINECVYCEDRVIWNPYRTRIHRSKKYNLDRKDNHKGYEPGNLVVCCSRCNYTKSYTLNYEEMILVGRYRQQKRLDALGVAA